MRYSRLLSAAALACSLALATGCSATPPPVSDKVQAEYEKNRSLAPTGHVQPAQKAVFVGDSYTAGAGSTQGSWADRMAPRVGWQFKNLALGGTGYLNQSSKAGCGLDFCPNYDGVIPGIAKESPTMVVVSGGRNDTALNPVDVQASITKFYQELHATMPTAKIIALSPVWDATHPPAALADIASSVQQAAVAAGGAYVDIGEPLAGHPELIAADKVHPNDAGHEALAVATEKALRAAGVVKP